MRRSSILPGALAPGLALFLTLVSGVAQAQPCDQCPGCKPPPSWAPPGSPDDCTDRAACLLTCVPVQGAADLATLRRRTLERLTKDEREAANRIQAELDRQVADVRTKAAAGRTSYEQILDDAGAQARSETTAAADAMRPDLRRALAPVEALPRQLKAVEICFTAPIPKVAQTAYRDVTQWAGRQKRDAEAALNAALAAVEAGLSEARADAARIFLAPVDQLAALDTPMRNVHDAAGRIRTATQSLTDLDALRNAARDGFPELRDLGDAGVTTVRDAGRGASASVQSLVDASAERARVARDLWLTRSRAALAAVTPGDAARDVASLAGLRGSLRKAGRGWASVLSCLCTNVDLFPPPDPKKPDALADASCIPPALEAPYEVALKEYRSERTFGGRFDAGALAHAARHVAAMSPGTITVRPAAGAPGSLFQPLTANPAWELVGPANLEVPYRQYYGGGPIAGRVNALAFDPSNPNTLFAGSAAGGLWRSRDRGATWEPLSDRTATQPGWPDLHVSSIAISPADPNVLYVGLGDYPGQRFAVPGGIMKTTDGGATWTNLGAALFGQFAVSQILIDPVDPSVLIATTGRGTGSGGEGLVWRSTDAGLNWTAVAAAPPAQWSGAAIGAFDPGAGNSAYYVTGTLLPVAPSTARGPVILVSTDRGVTWTAPTPPSTVGETVFSVAASRTDPNTVYGLLPGSRRILKSLNRGANWTLITAGFPNGDKNLNWTQAGYNYFIACGRRQGKDVLYVGLIDVALSPDGGATWKSIGGPTYEKEAVTHNDQHAIALHPTSPDEFLLGNDGGVYRGTLDSSHANILDPVPGLVVSFESLNGRLPITMFYRAAFDPSRPDVMLGGSQDNATPVSTGDLQRWRNRGGGDGGGVAISSLRPNIQYTTSQGTPGPFTLFQTLDVYRTASGWEIHRGPFAGAGTGQQRIWPFVGTDRLPFTPAVTIDPVRSTVVYLGTQFLWRLDDQFPLSPWRWSKVSTTALSTGQLVKRIAVAPSDNNTIYTASGDGEVWVSFDRGTTWKRLNAGPTAPCTVPLTGGSVCPSANALSVNPADPNDVLVGYSNSLPAGSASPQTVFRCTGANTPTPVWTDVSGTAANALPNVPVNAVERDLDNPGTTIFVGTDLGVFMSTDSGAKWKDVGTPFGLPRVQVTDLVAVPATRFLNAATFGRGMWRLPL